MLLKLLMVFLHFFLKSITPAIAFPLSCLFTMSMESGILPAVWKVAYVCPMFKKGARHTYIKGAVLLLHEAKPNSNGYLIAHALCARRHFGACIIPMCRLFSRDETSRV